MLPRPFWTQRIEAGWREAPIIWLSGVRRCGKTTIAKSLGEGRALYLNCDLPTVGDMVNDPALFYRNCGRELIVFDEVH
ncbi:MAG: AAA family ATPase, partial [Elusimicrobiota bacterium]